MFIIVAVKSVAYIEDEMEVNNRTINSIATKYLVTTWTLHVHSLRLSFSQIDNADLYRSEVFLVTKVLNKLKGRNFTYACVKYLI